MRIVGEALVTFIKGQPWVGSLRSKGNPRDWYFRYFPGLPHCICVCVLHSPIITSSQCRRTVIWSVYAVTLAGVCSL